MFSAKKLLLPILSNVTRRRQVEDQNEMWQGRPDDSTYFISSFVLRFILSLCHITIGSIADPFHRSV
jgi:hypothetical protein